jgi:Spy/CpxP family protein refolding chaperone
MMEALGTKRFPTAAIALFASALSTAGCEAKTSPGEMASGGPVAQTSSPLTALPAPSASGPSASASAYGGAIDRRHGLAGVFFRAARQIDLTEAQKSAISKLEPTLETAQSSRVAFETYHSDLLAGIKAGQLDAAKMQGDVAAVGQSLQAGKDTEVSALTGLYQALDGSHRTALVDAIRAKQAARETDHKRPFERGDGGGPDWAKRRLDRMVEDLDLDAGQQKQLAALVANESHPDATSIRRGLRETGKSRLDALLTAFEGDAFDPKSIDPSTIAVGAGKAPHAGLDRQVSFLNQLLPILRSDQRGKLAALFDRRRVGADRTETGEAEGDPFDDTQGPAR